MKKIWWFVTGVLLSFSVALIVFVSAGFLSGAVWRVLPVFGDQAGVVSPGAVLKKENYFLCGDVELIFQGLAPGGILGKNLKELRGKYPESAGWSVEMKDDKMVVLRKKVDDFCGQHSLYRHLGIHNDRLAVYQGPLGFNHRLLRVEENKKLDQLPGDLREKLQKAREYDRLSPDERSALRYDLEFFDETALNSSLENLDEVSRRGGPPAIGVR